MTPQGRDKDACQDYIQRWVDLARFDALSLSRTLRARVDLMRYEWRGFAFDLPEGLEDESVLTFLHRQGGQVDVNITLTRDALSGPLESYLGDAVDSLKRSLSAYRLVDQQTRKVAGREARVLEHEATATDGRGLWQKQAYIVDGKDVVIVTVTSRDDERAQGAKTFEDFLASLQPL